MTVFWYLSKQFLKSFLAICFIIGAIVFIVDGIDQYARIKGYGGDVASALLFVGLRVPNSIYNFFPLIFLLAALTFFLSLSRHSELVALRAAGVPATRIVLVPIIMSLVLSFVILVPFHQLMVSARGLSQSLIDNVIGRPNDTIRTVSNGAWIKESYGGNSRFIYINRVRWHDRSLQNVEVFTNTPSGARLHIIAKRGKIENGNWVLNDTLTIQNDQSARQEAAEISLPTNLDFDNLFSSFVDPGLVQLTQLPKVINQLDDDGYDVLPARTLLYSELATPIFYVFLCLVGSIFALAPMRGGGTSRRVLFALGTGFGFYFLTKLTESAAKAGNVPILIGVLAVPIAGILFTTALLLHQEDG